MRGAISIKLLEEVCFVKFPICSYELGRFDVKRYLTGCVKRTSTKFVSGQIGSSLIENLPFFQSMCPNGSKERHLHRHREEPRLMLERDILMKMS